MHDYNCYCCLEIVCWTILWKVPQGGEKAATMVSARQRLLEGTVYVYTQYIPNTFFTPFCPVSKERSWLYQCIINPIATQ